MSSGISARHRQRYWRRLDVVVRLDVRLNGGKLHRRGRNGRRRCLDGGRSVTVCSALAERSRQIGIDGRGDRGRRGQPAREGCGVDSEADSAMPPRSRPAPRAGKFGNRGNAVSATGEISVSAGAPRLVSNAVSAETLARTTGRGPSSRGMGDRLRRHRRVIAAAVSDSLRISARIRSGSSRDVTGKCDDARTAVVQEFADAASTERILSYRARRASPRRRRRSRRDASDCGKFFLRSSVRTDRNRL